MTIRALRSTKPLRALGIGAVVAAIGVGPVLGSYATEGRAGLGDRLYPRYGNSGYDVSHYDIGVAYDPATERLTGTTTITARADQPLSQFDLDFVLTVQSVTVNGVAASFQRHDVTTPADNYGGELVIRPATRVDAGATMTIVVSYSGTPATRLVDGFSPWVATSTGAVALGEPEAAAWWFPSNDHPSDKATYDISMTLPAGLTGVSNGVLVSHVTAGTGTTWHWRERRPMSTYLAFAAMGSYSLKTSSSHGTPVYIAVAHQVGPWRDTIKTDINRTAEVIGWESGLFGPYPFDAMGAVVPDATFGYALENESKPVYDREFWFGGPAMYVVAHENAHQWFGDDVSLAQWQDIWLNEGFATYAEWLWSEHEHTGTAQSVFDATYASHSAGSSFWTTAIAQPTIPQTFGDAVYDRGGMTLNALRVRLGSDAAFFQLLQDWVVARGGATGTTADFIALAERESGLDLTSFFHAWLYAKTRPAATAANGFPPLARAQLRDGTSRRPASWADLRRTHALLTRSQPAHGRLTG